MLDQTNDPRRNSERRMGSAEDEIIWSIEEVRIVLRRYGKTIIVCAGVFFFLGLVYSTTATRQFTAYARLLIDTPRNPLAALDGGGGPSVGLAVPEVESQLQVIVSDRIGFKVLERIKGMQVETPDSMEDKLLTISARKAKDILRSLVNVFSDEPGLVEPERIALAKLMAGLAVRRIGSSYVVEIAYTFPNPDRAAQIANAFAEAYVQDEIDTKAQIWQRASLWLQDRVNELRIKSEDASRAAQDFKTQNGNNAETWPRARELDRMAEVYDALYAAFLKRYTDSVQQQTSPITQARIIGTASRPALPSKPQTGLILALMTLIGSGLGISMAFIRWRLDRTIRSAGQINRYGLRCLATIPNLPRLVSKDPRQVLHTVVRAPRSQFTESLRLVRAEISLAERTRSMRYIGITCALPGEGKTSIAANLAQLLATGGPTLLVDADIRNPQLTELLRPKSRFVPDVRSKDTQAYPFQGSSTLDFLGVDSDMENLGASWFETGGFERMLEKNQDKYSRIIVDLPPASVVAEARFVAPLLDAIIVIIEWESTPADAFLSCVNACDVDPGKVFGAILNKMNPTAMHQGRGSSAYSKDYIEEEPLRGLRVRL